MIKEDAHEIMTQLELRREISKLKHELKMKDRQIQTLKNKIERMKKGR